MWLFEYTNSAPLLHLHKQYFSILRVLISIAPDCTSWLGLLTSSLSKVKLATPLTADP